jgi:two-component system, OmpR family, KDP operon response regulator KdpE
MDDLMSTESILVIDDEVQIRMLLEITLHAQGYKIYEASAGKEGMLLAASLHPSLIILDLGLPDADGMEILRRLREWYQKPVIILSVRNSEEDIIRALDTGASDYLTKPFRTGELLARVRGAIRQNTGAPALSFLTIGNLSIDLLNHVVKKNNSIVKLTPTEFSLLSLFVRYEGRVLTHQHILNKIWGSSYSDQTQYLRVFVAQLRKKLEENPLKPTMLVTESGIGYRFGQ